MLLLGASSALWEARQESTGRVVALKVPRYATKYVQELLADEAQSAGAS